jgi:hypothetical protein
MRRFGLMLLIAVCAEWATASIPLLNIPYQITAVDALTNGLFRLQGYVYDASQLGYGAPDVETNDYVLIQGGITGDIDLYRISNIWSQADSWLVVDVVYAENGTPRSGQPESGFQEISRDGFLYSTTFGGPSEYLQNGARNLFYRIMGNRITAIETNYDATAEQVLTNGATIQVCGNIKISTTNDLILLGSPQIQTNGVSEGKQIFVRGASVTGGIMFTNGAGVALDCKQSFLFGTNDLMTFFFSDGQWVETKRIDRKTQ